MQIHVLHKSKSCVFNTVIVLEEFSTTELVIFEIPTVSCLFDVFKKMDDLKKSSLVALFEALPLTG